MFNVGGGEFLLIALVALLILGPDKLPDFARKSARVLGQLRSMSQGFQNEMRGVMNLDDTDTPQTSRGPRLVGPIDTPTTPVSDTPSDAATSEPASPGAPSERASDQAAPAARTDLHPPPEQSGATKAPAAARAPPDTPVSARPQELAGGHMTIWEHIAELRSRLIKCAIAVAIGALIGWFLTPAVLDFIRQPYEAAQAKVGGDPRLLALDPLEPFMVRLKLAGYLGIAFAMPVLLWQIWRFVTPGLYPHEKKYAIPFVASSLALFALGASIAYYTLNPALEFLTSIAGEAIITQYSPEKYVTLVLYMMLAFGAGFEFPVLLVALQLIGVLNPRQLVGFWRTAMVIIAVVAAVITPSQDPISMAALAVPMALLYWGAIGVGALLLRLRKRKRSSSGDATPAGA